MDQRTLFIIRSCPSTCGLLYFGVYTKQGEETDIALASASLLAKRRILSVCVWLFLEKGYCRATLAEIIEQSDVSYSTFQNIFRFKDGVLTEQTERDFLLLELGSAGPMRGFMAQRVLHQLFQALSMRYEFSLTGIEEVVSTEESEGKR